MKRKNVLITAGVVATVVAFVLLVPLPCKVKCAVELRPRDSRMVFVKVPGIIAADGVHVAPGDYVEQGAPLVNLVNHDLEVSLADLDGQIAQQQAAIEGRLAQRSVDPASVSDLPALHQGLEALRYQRKEKANDLQQLTVAAPVSGTVLPPGSRPARKPADGQLAAWHGSPLDPQNEGAFLDESVLVCELGDAAKMEAVLIIDQGDVELVRQDQQVQIKMDAYTGETLTGTITDIAENRLEVAPAGLSQQAGGALATRTDEAGVQRPLNTSYVALVPIDNSDHRFRLGMRGQAKIRVAPRTLGQRLGRWIMRTIRFEL